MSHLAAAKTVHAVSVMHQVHAITGPLALVGVLLLIVMWLGHLARRRA
jgi:hypothetical protein